VLREISTFTEASIQPCGVRRICPQLRIDALTSYVPTTGMDCQLEKAVGAFLSNRATGYFASFPSCWTSSIKVIGA
jgi:hypothetical protein